MNASFNRVLDVENHPAQKSLDRITRDISFLTNELHAANAQKLSDDPLLPEKTVASMLGVSCSLLQHQRLTGRGIEFVKIGRSVRYKKSAVDTFLLANTRRSTSEQEGKR